MNEPANGGDVERRDGISSGLAVGILILNLVIPGVGTLIAGPEYKQTGIYQLVLYVVGIVLSIILIGYLLVLGAWVWALVTSIEILKKAS